MSGPKRNPDKLNTIGIVVVGICGAVLVYVSIVALQAFYLGDSSDVQMMADYGGQDTTFKSLRSSQLTALNEIKPNTAGKDGQQTFVIPIDHAKQLVLRDAKKDPRTLVPAVGPADKATLDVPPVGPDGRLPRLMAAPPAAPADAGSAAAPGTGAAGSAAGTPDSPSPPPAGGVNVQPTPTGGTGPGGGIAPQNANKLESPTPAGTPRVQPEGAIGGAQKPAQRGNGR